MSKFVETTIDAVKDRELPKWPQVFLTGKDVSKEQALDILFRTDQFINSLGVLGGNDREWETRAARRMGVPTREEQYGSLEKAKLFYKMMDAWYKRDGGVKTEVGGKYEYGNWSAGGNLEVTAGATGINVETTKELAYKVF